MIYGISGFSHCFIHLQVRCLKLPFLIGIVVVIGNKRTYRQLCRF